jgi:hypothetical protein
MKFKLNWGQSLALAMFAFMVFILSFVYKTFTRDSYDHHLVSDSYYQDEIVFQKEIDAKSNASKLSENVKLSNSDEGIVVRFPKEINQDAISGNIKIMRPTTDKLDLVIPIKLENSEMTILKRNLIKGVWNIRIDWKANETEYLYKEDYYY